MPKKDKCVMFCTSSVYLPGVANVIIGIEKYSPGLINNYVIFYDVNDPISDNDILALDKISRGKVLIRQAAKNTVLSNFEMERYSPLLLQKFHIFELLEEYHHVIYLEADMLIQNDISDAFLFNGLSFLPHGTKLLQGVPIGSQSLVTDFVDSDSVAPSAGVILVEDCLLAYEVDFTKELYGFASKFRGLSSGMTIDELCFGLLAAKFKLRISPLPLKYHCLYFVENPNHKAAIIHAIGSDKFWNNRLLNILYPEWNDNNNYWVACGGSNYSGEVKYANLIGTKKGDIYNYLDNLIQENMRIPNAKEKMNAILNYAEDTGSWNKKIYTEKADIVCAYGLGECFRDSFELWNFRENFHVKYCCDRDASHGKKVSAEYGLHYLSLDELKKMGKTENVVVILFLGAPSSPNNDFITKLKNDFIKDGINAITVGECILCKLSNLPEELSWFSEQKRKIIQVYEFLNDAESKIGFLNIIAQRMEPYMADFSYAELNKRAVGAYFSEKFVSLHEGEVLCDCGAYTGTSIDMFLKCTKGFDYIYAFEIAEDNFEELHKNMNAAETIFPALTKQNYKLIHAGLWDCSGEISYGKEDKAGTAGYTVLKDFNKVAAKTVTIDAAVDRPVTFIKMNIEGAELKALHGAEKTITAYHPTLAINVSHRLQDLWEIPFYVRSIVPEYKIYIRHTSSGAGGTIMYAVYREGES